MFASTVENAKQDPTSHQFVPKMGYVGHSRLPDGSAVKTYRNVVTACHPPVGTTSQTMHMLVPPGGGRPLRFMWLANDGAWERPGGVRVAFPAGYLAKRGWTYGRAVIAVSSVETT